jgi:hypothetical protein
MADAGAYHGSMAQLLEYFKFERRGSWNSFASDSSDPLRPALLVVATLFAFQSIVAALGFLLWAQS